MEHIYDYVNGKPVGSRNEFIFESRHRGPIESDEELLEFARKVTHNWLSAGWCRTFIGFYLSDYALAEPYCSLTKTEFNRLKNCRPRHRRKRKPPKKPKAGSWQDATAMRTTAWKKPMFPRTAKPRPSWLSRHMEIRAKITYRRYCKMTNAEVFKKTFGGMFATELWSMAEEEFLKWLNAEHKPVASAVGEEE